MKIVSILIACLIYSQTSVSAEVDHIEENIRKLGFDRYYSELKRNSGDYSYEVRVAVFDYGFDGYQKELGFTIPERTIYKARPGDTNDFTFDRKSGHGLAMAQILTQYMTNNYQYWKAAPKIYFYKTNGYTNLKWAIDDAISNHVDIVLHSIVYEYGSNYDGKGFFNDLVNRATDAGIVWINSAGNFGETTYNSNIKLTNGNWVDFDLANNAVPVSCEFPRESKVKKQNRNCSLRLVLSWDDFKNKPFIGTDKDLDIYLYDENFEKTIAAELTQVEDEAKSKNKEGYSLYPREIIQTSIPEGTYYIKVRSKKDNFTINDRLRITADGDYIQFPERDASESILNPADNPNVITVGENSPRSSVSRSLNKPELVAPSLVIGEKGMRYKGSSNAAAVVAAGVGLMKKINPNLSRDEIVELSGNKNLNPRDFRSYQSKLESSSFNLLASEYIPTEVDGIRSVQSSDGYRGQNPYSIPTELLGFQAPPGVGCFPPADIKQVEPCVVADFIVKSQSLLVSTTAGLKIATSFDPIVLLRGDTRLDLRDKIAIFPTEGMPFRRVPANIPLPRGAIEIFKMPVDQILCKIPDWDFMVTQLEESRRRVYEANQTGPVNHYIPQNCSVESLSQTRYPRSNWSMYPILQQVPYGAPVGPAPVDIRRQSYPRQNGGYGYQPERSYDGEDFRMPDPNQIEE